MPDDASPNRLAVGCLLALPGFFGGAMIALGIGLIVDRVTGCQVPDVGPTVCNWQRYVLVGGVMGLLLLEGAVQWRLRRAASASRRSERS
jgi:hypothetical protein